MAEPLVVQVIRQFKADLLAREAAQMGAMTRQWIKVEDALEVYIAALSESVGAMVADGNPPTASQIIRMDRYRSLLAQAEREIKKYMTYAEGTISDGQQKFGETGLESAAEAIKASYKGAGKVVGAFDVLPVNAVEAMVGLAGDGSPLADLLKAGYPEAAAGMTDALVRAVALGINPRETARELARALSVGLNKALVISRTEQLRAFREAARMQYQASGLVSGYKRIAAHDSRVCAGCLFLDGKAYDLDESFDEHPQGRCALIPVVKNLPVVTWQNGQSWFEQQDEGTQRSILGSGRYDAWQDGAFDLGDVVQVKQNSMWGGSVGVKPLGELQG